MRRARGRWASSELLEITWAHLAIIWLLLKTRPSNYASANGRQKTELWLRKVIMTCQCHGGDCGFFWVQACWRVCHIPGWGTHSWEWNLIKTAKLFAVLLNCISPVIFSDTRNKIITCFGSSFCTPYYTKSGLDEIGMKGTMNAGFSMLQGFPTASKTKETEHTDVCVLLQELWTNSFSVSGMQIFFHSLAVFFGFQHSELTLSWIPRPPENQMDERNWEKEPTLFEKGMNFSLCI